MSRIVIEDLPVVDQVTEEQLNEIMGAGRKSADRRLTFQSLEERRVMTASAVSMVVPASAPALASTTQNTIPSVVIGSPGSGTASSAVPQLQMAQSLLATAIKDYNGYRAAADSDVIQAINDIASNQTIHKPTTPPGETQQQSDNQLSQALSILQTVQSEGVLTASPNHDVTAAVNHIVDAFDSQLTAINVTPDVPQVTATPRSTTQVELNWNSVGGATNYEVERWDSVNQTWALVSNVGSSTTKFIVGNLLANTPYQFSVVALNVNASSRSAGQSVSTLLVSPPSDPDAPDLGAVTVTALPKSSLPLVTQLSSAEQLLATAVEDYNGYRAKAYHDVVQAIDEVVGNQPALRQSPTPGETQPQADIQLAQALATLQSVQNGGGLAPEVNHTVTIAINNIIKALNSRGTSTTVAPDAPVLSVAQHSSSQLDLSWNSVGGATNYEIQMWNSADNTWTAIANVGSSTTSFTVGNLNSKTSYSFAVVAINVTSSTWSAPQSAKTA